MTQMSLSELHMNSRAEVIGFLKKLWNKEPAPCPLCGKPLEPLHKNPKRSSDDRQCRSCGKTVRTISLLMELNEKMPD